MGFSWGAVWVFSALRRWSGRILVIHPESRAGKYLAVRNVEHCFHLFTLIQAAIGTDLPGGHTPDPEVVALAHHPSSGTCHDEAWWHYGDPRSPQPDMTTSIWGEATVAELPVVDGVPVILLWSPILGTRSWSSSFFDPELGAFPPDVVVERELESAEIDAWLTKLNLAGPAR